MKRTAWLATCLLMTLAIGCHTRPEAGMAAAKVRVLAKPKAGLTEGFVHVPVYDAAPTPPIATGAFEHVDYSHLTDIIVWIEPTPAYKMSAPSPATIEIDPTHPSSNVHPASVGGKIFFHNRSSQTVSLYSVSDGNDFNLTLAPGATGEYTVRSEGLIELLANPAKPPIAQLYAAPSPWVAQATSGHTVTFNNVPPGKYQAISWHPRLPASTADMNLTAGEITGATLTVGVNALAQNP